ncbi:MAG: hypothetical protein AAFN08_12255, partial [Cyanobacteria bacterium J06559_3]
MKNDSGLFLDFDRIAVSADGNADPDDVGATPAGLAMLAHADLQDSLVHYHVNSQVWGKPDSSQSEKMRTSAFGSADRMGFDEDVFFDAVKEFQQGPNNPMTQHLAKAINASSANDRLLIIGAGPMEAIYQAVKLADSSKRAFVEVLSHSSVNDKNTGSRDTGHTRTDIEKLGVSFIDIKDQNRGFSTKKDFGPWSWMKTADPNWQWVYDRMQAGGKADISDAGMVYYALTGDERGDIDKLQAFLDADPAPNPGPQPTPAPIPEPQPEPQPEPEPEPEPEPQPEPEPEPQPEPQPEPIPEPQPEPVPEPQPEPIPEPQPEPQPQPDPTSKSLFTLSLMDATTDEVVEGYENLGSISKIDLSDLDLTEFTLVAQVNSSHPDADSVKSVKFESNFGTRTENVVPYALFGDTKGDLTGKLLNQGDYTIKATAYTQPRGGGSAIATVEADYTIIDPGNAPITPSPTPSPTPPPSGPDDPKRVNIKGSNASETLIGSGLAQKMLGRGGNDTIRAGGGSDLIKGGNGDDALYGDRGNDTINGNKGNDLLVGVAVKDAQPGLGEQDVMMGGSQADTYVLGDASQAYYDDGNAQSTGESDFAVIKDFNQKHGDQIQLHGEANDYHLGSSSAGNAEDVGIFLKTSGQNELI